MAPVPVFPSPDFYQSMVRTLTLRAALTLPAALAVAFVGFISSARADVAARITDLDNKLKSSTFAGAEGKTQVQTDAYNRVTATADDLVYAVYELAQTPGFTDQDIADLAQAALTAIAGTTPATAKVRADKDKIVGRILEAALVAAAPSTAGGAAPVNQADLVDKLVQQLASVNSGLGVASKQLTAAGKQLLIAKALRSSTSAAAAQKIAARAATLVPTATSALLRDNARTAFHVAVLKQLAYKPITNDPALALPTKGTYFPIRDGEQVVVKGEPFFQEGTPPSVFNVRDYVDSIIDGYEQANIKSTAAFNIAAGVAATVPSAAGAAIAGYVQDFKAGGATDQQVLDYLKGATPATSIIGSTKLAAAVSDVVADSLKLLTAPPTDAQVTALVTGQTIAVKGKAASGIIRANPLNATAIFNDVLNADNGVAGKGIVTSGVAAFAGAAAQGNDGAADDIAIAAINSAKLPFVPATTGTAAAQLAALKADKTKIQAVAIAVGKSVALVNPNAMADVAEQLVQVTRGTAGAYYAGTDAVGEGARQNLAADLAKGLTTNYAAAGAAVQGVVRQSLAKFAHPTDGDALNQIGNIVGLAVKAAPKAAVNIALKVAHDSVIQSSYSNSKTSSDLAAAFASNPNVATANAGAVAAGVSLADTAHSGVITAAVINAPAPTAALFAARQAAALTIANTVAINVDVEAIGLVAQSVGALLQPAKNVDGTTNASKLPKLTTIGTLATSLAKAINTKPLVNWDNRVDELNELAAELTKQYLTKAGVANSGVPDGVDANSATAQTAELKALSSGLASIGTSIFKAASAKLLADSLNNAADLKDIAEGVSGAIAQVLANSSLPLATRDFLLNKATSGQAGYLLKLLETGAKTFAGSADNAFAAVALTKSGSNYGTVTGTVLRYDGTLGKYEIGANYETGNVNASETPVKNL